MNNTAPPPLAEDEVIRTGKYKSEFKYVKSMKLIFTSALNLMEGLLSQRKDLCHISILTFETTEKFLSFILHILLHILLFFFLLNVSPTHLIRSEWSVWVGGDPKAGKEVWSCCVRQQLKTCAVNPIPITQYLFGCTGFKLLIGIFVWVPNQQRFNLKRATHDRFLNPQR